MARWNEYKLLADSAFKRASEEQSAQLQAQWKTLGERYLELANQSEPNDEKDERVDN